jgi:hypothetical protein
MAHNYLVLEGRITEDGRLEVTLPPDAIAEPVRVTIESVAPPAAESATVDDNTPLTAEEVAEFMDMLLNPKPATMGEILNSGLIGALANWDRGDPAEWIHKSRLTDDYT